MSVMSVTAIQQCAICQQPHTANLCMPSHLLSTVLQDYVQREYPAYSVQQPICLSCLNGIRQRYIQHVITEEQQKLVRLQQEVAQSLIDQETFSRNINIAFERELTFGDRLSDQVAAFGGSWTFIIMFGVILLLWMAYNSWALVHQFDPYPFILLNLVLSSIAALQAPIIMMSQNRQEAKDRLRSENDYKVNLKAELEIRHLHAKMDLLLTTQWQRLLEIQQIQLDLMSQIAQQIPRDNVDSCD